MKLRTLFAIFSVAIFSVTSAGYAAKEARPLATDSRIRIVNYQENEVFKFLGHYGYQTSIEFERGAEVVQTISIGDSTAWQIVPSGDRIFIKPVDKNATTNMTVITDKRIYHFELHASEADDIRSPDMVFVMRFIYPNEEMSYNVVEDKIPVPELEEPGKYNFNYSLTGPEYSSPIKIFDDGTFTYFQFKPNAEIPAFFIVNSDGKEQIVNYRARGDYIVIERVASRFTLRAGSDVVCVYNDSMPRRPAPK